MLPRYELKELEAAKTNFIMVIETMALSIAMSFKKPWWSSSRSQQIGILQNLNHFNLVTERHSYLVFKYADNGSLADYL